MISHYFTAENLLISPAGLEYFIFSFTADFGEAMQDIIADDKKDAWFTFLLLASLRCFSY